MYAICVSIAPSELRRQVSGEHLDPINERLVVIYVEGTVVIRKTAQGHWHQLWRVPQLLLRSSDS